MLRLNLSVLNSFELSFMVNVLYVGRSRKYETDEIARLQGSLRVKTSILLKIDGTSSREYDSDFVPGSSAFVIEV